MAEWWSSWLAEQEDLGSIPRLATWIFRDWLSPASKSIYGWKIAKSTLIKNNQPTTNHTKNNKQTNKLLTNCLLTCYILEGHAAITFLVAVDWKVSPVTPFLLECHAGNPDAVDVYWKVVLPRRLPHSRGCLLEGHARGCLLDWKITPVTLSHLAQPMTCHSGSIY